MTETEEKGFLSLLIGFFQQLTAARTVGMDALQDSSSEAGVDVPAFRSIFLAKAARLFGMDESSGVGGYIQQNSAISREAAARIGYADGVVPTSRHDEFSRMEEAVAAEVDQLTCRLRARSVALYDRGVQDPWFHNAFQHDEQTKSMILDATERGMSPVLIDSVKSKLISEEQNLFADHEKFARSLNIR